MKLELYNPRIFKEVFECISKIVDECRIDFDNLGMKINALDKSHITFIELEFKYTLFDEYQVPEDESIYIDADEFNKVLKRCKNTDVLKLETFENDLIIVFDGDATKRYKLRLIDNEYESPQPPRIDYNVRVSAPSTLMKDALSDIKLFSENMKISAGENYLLMQGDGLKGDAMITYLHGENVDQFVSSGFSIEKLIDIFRCSKLSETVKLELGNDMPLSLRFELPLGDGHIQFLLAPRINEEE